MCEWVSVLVVATERNLLQIKCIAYKVRKLTWHLDSKFSLIGDMQSFQEQNIRDIT